MQQRRESHSYLLEDLTRTPRDPIKQIDSSDRTAEHHEEELLKEGRIAALYERDQGLSAS